VTTRREGDVGGVLRVHRMAQEDWLEAMALVEEIRTRAVSTRVRAQERLRFAGDAMRSRGSDPWALAMLDAAELHAGRARAEAERLAVAEARLQALQARVRSCEGAIRAAVDYRVRVATGGGGRGCG
jgi:hypothetical protein